jgi:hypothetical protein
MHALKLMAIGEEMSIKSCRDYEMEKALKNMCFDGSAKINQTKTYRNSDCLRSVCCLEFL